MENRKVLVTLTTLHDWQKKIEEIKKFQLEEIALFLTGLMQPERKELYKALENTVIKSIPHVHLRNDMELWELDYLTENFNTKAFNIHPVDKYPLLHDWTKYKHIIYIENTAKLIEENDLVGFAGICIDFSHWEDYVKKQGDNYDPNKDIVLNLASRYKIGCVLENSIKEQLEAKDYLEKIINE